MMQDEEDSLTAVNPNADTDELGLVIGGNLKRIRTRRGLTLDALAKQSGVSRAMIGQIEAGRSMPTIGLLWKITSALNIPFATLMGGGGRAVMTYLPLSETKVLTSRDGRFRSRALFPFDGDRRVEFYELRLDPHVVEDAEPHSPGTTENLVVSEGEVEIIAGQESRILTAGDALHFMADMPHSYRNNTDKPAILFLVMTYPEPVG